MDFDDGDLAYRINFATARRGRQIVDRRVGRDLTSEEAHALADEVNATLRLPDATFELRATIEHRGALVIQCRRGSLSANVTNTDPAYRREGHLGVALETFDPVVVVGHAARRLRRRRPRRRPHERVRRGSRSGARRIAGERPATRPRASCRRNLILTRDGGDHRPRLQPIRDRFGWGWGCFVEMPVERGIAIALGMEAVDAPRLDPAGFGPSAEEAYAAWADLAAEALDGYQALYVHIKGPDVPAHDGRAEDKRDVIDGDRPGVLRRGAPAARPGPDGRRGAGRPRHVLRPQGAHGRPGAAGARRRRVHLGREHVLRRAGVRRRLARASSWGSTCSRSSGRPCGDGSIRRAPRDAYTELSGLALCPTLAASMKGRD